MQKLYGHCKIVSIYHIDHIDHIADLDQEIWNGKHNFLRLVGYVNYVRYVVNST